MGCRAGGSQRGGREGGGRREPYCEGLAQGKALRAAGLTVPGTAEPGPEETGQLLVVLTSSPSHHLQERAVAAPLPARRGAADVAKYVKE